MREIPGEWPDAPPRPFALPARFIEASEGAAVYVVSSAVATSVLGEVADFVSPFELGGGRTLLAVIGIDYRVSDLGQCNEIALAVSVRPRNDRTGPPGAMFVGIAVSSAFSRDASRAIWGLHKVFHKDLSVSYRPDRVRFGLTADHPGTLSVAFPRFGTAASNQIPIPIYSRLESSGSEAATPLRSIMSLSGRGEGVQVGGSVSIRVGQPNAWNCICRGAVENCLCRTLQKFDVEQRLPALNVWIGHLSGAFEAPEELGSAVRE
jgi:hypothetical protein